MPSLKESFSPNHFLVLAIVFFFSFTVAAQSTDIPPPWAYTMPAPGYKPPVDSGELRHVPDSSASWTLTQLRDRFYAPDWHPEEHPAMPEVVARGRKPDVLACGFCHRAEGTGGPENSNIAGLPATYIVQQMAAFKSGIRKSSLPDRTSIKYMTATAKSATDSEVAEAAAYFSSIKPRKLITVVETADVPKNYVAAWVYSPTPEAETSHATEPLGGRILEMPKDLEQFESRDTHSEFIAYVPVGSVAAGKKLATTGSAGKTLPCAQCHGNDLRGSQASSGKNHGKSLMENVPGIAGRSPSYLFRQLYDFQHGTRTGSTANLMKPIVMNLSTDDLTALSAYAASLDP
ncbi:MAG: c-type cytochrome [Acidobacteria bacterium]|nr:c-type cytochrome [Acidobacteriota bacterium]MBS1864338.1 c-type cytochrome [Acidobacteriota bacterium]